MIVVQRNSMLLYVCTRIPREREWREREKRKSGAKEAANLYLLLRSLSEAELGTNTCDRKPSIRASKRYIASYIWWSIRDAAIEIMNLLLLASSSSSSTSSIG